MDFFVQSPGLSAFFVLKFICLPAFRTCFDRCAQFAYMIVTFLFAIPFLALMAVARVHKHALLYVFTFGVCGVSLVHIFDVSFNARFRGQEFIAQGALVHCGSGPGVVLCLLMHALSKKLLTEYTKRYVSFTFIPPVQCCKH